MRQEDAGRTAADGRSPIGRTTQGIAPPPTRSASLQGASGMSALSHDAHGKVELTGLRTLRACELPRTGPARPEGAPSGRHRRRQGGSPVCPKAARPKTDGRQMGPCEESARFWPRNRVLARIERVPSIAGFADLGFPRTGSSLQAERGRNPCQNAVSWPESSRSHAWRDGARPLPLPSRPQGARRQPRTECPLLRQFAARHRPAKPAKTGSVRRGASAGMRKAPDRTVEGLAKSASRSRGRLLLRQG